MGELESDNYQSSKLDSLGLIFNKDFKNEDIRQFSFGFYDW